MMDYEKAYKAVLQTATQWIKDGCTDKEKICLECVFPELRESEDEKIRKVLMNMLYYAHPSVLSRFGVDVKKAIAYLEKQKEQKPDWSEEDEETIEILKKILKVNHPNGKFKITRAGTTDKYISTNEVISRLESLCPQPHLKLSEDQMAVLFNAEGLMRANDYKENAKILAEVIEELKKLCQ